MATISSAGIGSGLDVASLVNQLMAVERQPLTALATKAKSVQSKISAYGTLTSALDKLKTAATALNTPSKINAYASTFSDTAFGTASATSSSSAGIYNIQTTNLAQAHTLASKAYGTSTDVVGDGTLQITSGSNSFSLTIDSTNDTLAGIRDAINASTNNTSVTASIITDSNGARLALTAKSTGLANKITVGTTPSGGTGLNDLAYPTVGLQGMTQGNAALDANLTVNGIAISSASNTISTVITGVSFTLSKANSSATLTIARDSSAVTTAATNFASAYSALASTVKNLTAYDASTKTGSLLTGDGTTSLMMSRLRSTLSSTPAGVTGLYSTLAEVGISIQADGSMSVDSTKLQSAIDNHFTDLQSVLGGFGKAIADVATSMTNTNGVVSSRVTSLSNSINAMSEQKLKLEDRMTRIQANYTRQYSALDALVGKMNSLSSYLTQQIAKL